MKHKEDYSSKFGRRKALLFREVDDDSPLTIPRQSNPMQAHTRYITTSPKSPNPKPKPKPNPQHAHTSAPVKYTNTKKCDIFYEIIIIPFENAKLT